VRRLCGLPSLIGSMEGRRRRDLPHNYFTGRKPKHRPAGIRHPKLRAGSSHVTEPISLELMEIWHLACSPPRPPPPPPFSGRCMLPSTIRSDGQNKLFSHQYNMPGLAPSGRAPPVDGHTSESVWPIRRCDPQPRLIGGSVNTHASAPATSEVKRRRNPLLRLTSDATARNPHRPDLNTYGPPCLADDGGCEQTSSSRRCGRTS